VRRSNQLRYEATDVGSWSFVSSSEVIYEMFHILNNLSQYQKSDTSKIAINNY